jgi:hypothetical protein
MTVPFKPIVITKDQFGALRISYELVRDHSEGDRQFLGELPVGTCALRPVLKSEVPEELSRRPGAVMLVCRGVEEGSLARISLHVPPHRRKNNRANVAYFLNKLRRVDADLASIYRDLNEGRL